MKKTKKVLALLLCVAMCATSMSVAFAGGPEATAEDAMTTGAKEDYSYVITEKDKAIAAEKEKLAESYQLQRAGSTVSVSMGHTRQIVGYYCGPAAVQNALSAFGVSVPESSNDLYFFYGETATYCPHPNIPHTHYMNYKSPQVTLAKEMNTTTSGTTFSELIPALNGHQDEWNYSAAHIDDTVNDTNIKDLRSKTTLALSNGAPVIIYVQADLLQPYKDRGTWLGHYICGEAYNKNTNVMTICDPNYYTAIPVRYTETASSVVNAIWNSSSTNGNLIW